jgi:hypothetical protein
MARVNKKFQIKGRQVMTDFGYCVLLLILGAVVVIALDTVLGILMLSAAIIGIGCELSDEFKRNLEEEERMLRNKRHK